MSRLTYSLGGEAVECGIHPNISGKSSTRSADQVISRLAARQRGVVARWQLLEVGVTAHQIDWRLRTGRLHELHRGVYLVGHSVPPPLAAEQAALLAHRNQAVLSHRSAASLWNLLPYPATAPVWITIPPERNPKRPGIETRRARLARRDIRWHQGLPLTSPPRTILDVASLLAKDDLESLVADAHFRHLASEPELHDQLARNRGRRGTGPDARLVVEVDGYDAHSGRASFERDRLKHATLNAGGLTVMPVTGRQVDQDPVGVVERLLRGLEDRLET